MGIRITKEIGYFVSIKDFPEFINSKIYKILESLDQDNEAEESFFKKLSSEMKIFDQNSLSQFALNCFTNDYSKAYYEKKLNPYHLIKEVHFHDTFKGLLFCTMEQYQARRHDDLIDYYEADFNPQITELNRAIYPNKGYIYKGGLKSSEMKQFEVVSDRDAEMALRKEGIFYEYVDPKMGSKLLMDTGFFHPNVENVIYLIAKSAQILENNISHSQFNFKVKPVIISSWS